MSYFDDDDYIKIYDINDDAKSVVIASLSGTDIGPVSLEKPYHRGHWRKKIISSSINNMIVEFRSDDQSQVLYDEGIGFSLSIHFSPLPGQECEKGLDYFYSWVNDKYGNTPTCTYLCGSYRRRKLAPHIVFHTQVFQSNHVHQIVINFDDNVYGILPLLHG